MESRLFFIVILCGCILFASAQENCFNGVDDNGNGLIDLNDPQCDCFGIVGNYTDVSDKIPNNDFETMDCCPHTISLVTACLTDWVMPTFGTPDYQNTCNFVMNAAYQANIYPFPSGEGVVGIICAPQWKEYIGTCLNSPLEVGKTYEFRVKMAFTALFMSGNYSLAPNPPYYPPVAFSIYGNAANCGSMDMNGVDCPPNLNNAWSEIGSVVVTPSNVWTTYIIRFSPPADIPGFIFGPGCFVPEEYRSAPITPYFWLDDMELYEIEGGGELTAEYSGHPCQENLELYANGEPWGGTYQWYYNGVAILGANEPTLLLSSGDYAPGYYQVRYTLGIDCMIEGFYLDWVLPEPSIENITFCQGDTVTCAGQIYDQPGTYEVRFTSHEGCDSVVTCHLILLPDSPPTQLQSALCEGEVMTICGEQLSETGEFQIRCQNIFGCDSIISLKLFMLNPVVRIIDPGAMDCDTSVLTFLDGTLSSANPDPQGITEYYWVGPQDGIHGRRDLPYLYVSKPGTYCLTMTHYSSGQSCTSVECIDIERPFTYPEAPVILPYNNRCSGDTILLRIDSFYFNPEYSYTWSHSNLTKINQNAGQILLLASQAGAYSVCVKAVNECGAGDSTCVNIQIFETDTSRITRNTCDPNLIQNDTIRLQNRYSCDSLIIINYRQVESDTVYLTTLTCSENQAGLDTMYYISVFGCDSIVIIRYDYSKPDTTLLEINRCDISQNYIDTLILGGMVCDSTIIIRYHSVPSDTLILQEYVCEPSEAGHDTVVLTNRFGCDSILYLSRILAQRDSIFLEEITCDQSTAGITDFRYTNRFGCDSIIRLERIYAPFTFSEQFVNLCGSAQNYTDTLQFNGNLCDSFVYVHYTFFPIDSVFLERITCDPSEEGFLVNIYQNVHGCDSIVSTQIRFEPSNLIEIYTTTCNPALAGTFTDSLLNRYGCDSIRIHYIAFQALDTLFLQEQTCNASEGGRFEWRFNTRENCDSIVVLERIVLPSDTVSIEYIDCDLEFPFTDTIRLRNQHQCDSLLIRTFVPDTSNLKVDLGQDKLSKEGEPISITAIVSGLYDTLLWSPEPDQSCAGCLNQDYTLYSDTEILLTAISPHGCEKSDRVKVRVVRNDRVFIPSAFTPDGDGVNDRFTVYGGPRLRLIKALSVFDRWGNMVYFGENLPPNDARFGWDGSWKGVPMDPAVFVYVAVVTFDDGIDKRLHGEVSLIR